MRARGGAALAVTVALLSGCGGTPILANPPLSFPSPEVTPSQPPRPPDPIPLAFPRDDGPHDRLTEWWYYTGHLRTAEGRRFGFEAVVFRAERSAVPTAWASHLALTDEANDRFHYAQRSEIGPHVDRSPVGDDGVPTGFDLQVSGLSPTLVAAGAPPAAAPWRLAGSDGVDRIEAALAPAEAGAARAQFGLRLDVRSVADLTRHDGDGFVDFGPAGSSYYYSRMRMQAAGTLALDGQELDVTGTAWFDHQWGDFVSVGGGWDWFAVNLDDGTNLTLSVVRDAEGQPVLEYGSLQQGGPAATPSKNLDPGAFTVESIGSWTSPHTGRTWPSGWRIALEEGLEIELRPTVLDQELDTRATTGVAYWEGSQVVRATRDGKAIGGEAYVELTRYTE
ncbi:MAG TPA: lipocalin-like domain-containing protein [Candidatus Limnocylindrales bacterium]|nr:lipocalin-like domain-containing protein [Candidatus Limnocylindrales bacterium]